MKRIKMMLLSLALFAVVGGALAFKAKFGQLLCATDAILNAGVYTCIDPASNKLLTCPVTVELSTIDLRPGAIPSFCTTWRHFLGKCPGAACGQVPTSLIPN
jgi:hypothetical protein